jgi:hypothetical protein
MDNKILGIVAAYGILSATLSSSFQIITASAYSERERRI